MSAIYTHRRSDLSVTCRLERMKLANESLDTRTFIWKFKVTTQDRTSYCRLWRGNGHSVNGREQVTLNREYALTALVQMSGSAYLCGTNEHNTRQYSSSKVRFQATLKIEYYIGMLMLVLQDSLCGSSGTPRSRGFTRQKITTTLRKANNIKPIGRVCASLWKINLGWRREFCLDTQVLTICLRYTYIVCDENGVKRPWLQRVST